MTNDEGTLRDFLRWAVADAWGAEPAPKLVPEEYRPELARLTPAELSDVAWLLAQRDMIELRLAIEAVIEGRLRERL